MTKLDFPDTPTTGQTFGSSGTVWRWDGTRWGSTAGASGARGAVAYKQSTLGQTGITTLVDLMGLSVSFTADPTRTYRISVAAMCVSNIAGDVSGTFITDEAGTVKQTFYDRMTGAAISQSEYFSVVETGLSGPITRKVMAQLVQGTGPLVYSASGAFPSFILVEDITYEAGSGGPVTDINTLPKGLLSHAYGPDTTGGFNIISTPMQISGLMVTPTLYAGRIYRVRTSITAQAGPVAAHIYVIVGDSVNTIFAQSMITRQANEYATLSCDYTFKATTYQPNRAFLGLISASQASAYIGGTLKAWLTCEDLGTIGTIS